MDSSGSSGNGEYCAYNETTAPISADSFICHHRYKQRPVSKPVKTHSFETGMPVYPSPGTTPALRRWRPHIPTWSPRARPCLGRKWDRPLSSGPANHTMTSVPQPVCSMNLAAWDWTPPLTRTTATTLPHHSYHVSPIKS